MVILWCRTLTDMRRLLWICCLSTLAIVILGMLSGASPERLSAGESYDANDLALILVMTLPLIMYLFSTTRGAVMRLLLGGMAFICLLAILRTQSRGGFIALVGVGALILLRTPMSRLNKVLTIAIALVIFLGMSDHAYWDRMGTILNPQSEYESTGGGRTEIWKAGLKLIAERPWGVGIDGFVTAEGLSHGGFGKWSSAHNSFIQLGVELGVVGMVIFVLLLVTALKQLRGIRALSRDTGHLAGKARLKDKAATIPFEKNIGVLASTLETSLLGFAIGGFFVSHAYNALLYTLIAVTICCHRLLQSEKTSEASANRMPTGVAREAMNRKSSRQIPGTTPSNNQ
jgi:O-antigen ligase